MSNWKTLKRKTTQKALVRACDAIQDLIEVIEMRGEDDEIDTVKIENLIHRLKRMVEIGGEQ